METEQKLDEQYCYRHPNRATMLRCNQCGRLICPDCAKRVPTGYRCPDCIRAQQKTFDTSKPFDFVLAVIASGVIAFLGSLIIGSLGFFTILVAPAVGFVIAEAVRFLTGRRRSRALFRVVAITAVIGCAPMLISNLLTLILGMANGANFLYILWGPIWQIVYAATVTSTSYYRLSGIQLFRR